MKKKKKKKKKNKHLDALVETTPEEERNFIERAIEKARYPEKITTSGTVQWEDDYLYVNMGNGSFKKVVIADF